MKFPVFKLMIVFLVSFLLTACAAAQGFVDLPDAQETGIKVVVTALLALAFDWLIGISAWLAFLRAYQEGFALALGLLAVSTIENYLPTGSDPIAIPAVGLFISVALYLLGRTLLARRRAKGFVKEDRW
jgi:predicted small secreted protein